MNTKIIFCLGLFLSAVSCHSKDSEPSYSIPTIRLNPEQADTLKVSDYIDHVSALWLKDCLYNEINDFIETKDGYLTELYYPNFLFLQFDKDGKFSHQLGMRGRGAGEYLSFKNNLQLSKDSTLLIIDNESYKFLEYALDGKVVNEKELNYKKYTKHELSFNNPQTIVYDSLLVLYPSDDILFGNKSMQNQVMNALKGSYFLQLYSMKSDEVIQSHFLMDEMLDFKVFNQFYKYNDSLYFYYDINQIIYQIGPKGKKEKYRIDKGTHNQLRTKEEYTEALSNGIVDTKRIIMQSCNETEQYIIGEYLFKNIFHTFIYDKQTGETKNYKIINNDFLGLINNKHYALFNFKKEFKFKENCLWLTVDRNFPSIMEKSKSNMTREEWEEFEHQHPDFAGIYQEMKAMGEKLEEETPIVLIRYYFK